MNQSSASRPQTVSSRFDIELEPDTYEVEEIELTERPSRAPRLSPRFLTVVLVAAAIPFGAIHPVPQAILILVLSIISLRLLSRLHREKGILPEKELLFGNSNRCFKLVVYPLFVLTCYVFIQSLLLTSTSLSSVGLTAKITHPLSGTLSRNLLPEFWESYFPFGAIFLLSFFIGYVYSANLASSADTSSHSLQRGNRSSQRLGRKKQKRHQTKNSITLGQFGSGQFGLYLMYGTWVIAAIGLLHWLNDDGRLFWYFSPFHESASKRVRWPLVNPNHFAFLILPGFIFALFYLKEALTGFTLSLFEDRSQRRHPNWGEFFSEKSSQELLAAITIRSIIVLTIGTAVVGSLSRAAWAGTLLGLSTLLFSFFLFRPSSHSNALGRISKKRSKRAKRKRDLWSENDQSRSTNPDSSLLNSFYSASKKSSLLLFGWSVCIGLGILSMIVLFLGVGAGQQRVVDRLAFGLLHTHDDMRWQLYTDSLSLLSWFGIGTSQWQTHFPAVMDQQLAGIRPVYLHSEPLQFLIEYGYVGGILLFVPLLLLFSQSAITLLQLEKKSSSFRYGCALLAALISLVFSLSFDFPLRIPVNMVLAGVLLGTLSSLVDRERGAS